MRAIWRDGQQGGRGEKDREREKERRKRENPYFQGWLVVITTKTFWIEKDKKIAEALLVVARVRV